MWLKKCSWVLWSSYISSFVNMSLHLLLIVYWFYGCHIRNEIVRPRWINYVSDRLPLDNNSKLLMDDILKSQKGTAVIIRIMFVGAVQIPSCLLYNQTCVGRTLVYEPFGKLWELSIRIVISATASEYCQLMQFLSQMYIAGCTMGGRATSCTPR